MGIRTEMASMVRVMVSRMAIEHVAGIGIGGFSSCPDPKEYLISFTVNVHVTVAVTVNLTADS
jgi:hypothetical protein